ncbi:hypothetical protein RSOL_019000, partial [Rhizoctonia solani AG-3 Rhs1AP]
MYSLRLPPPSRTVYLFPIFSTERNDLPLSPETGIFEVQHVVDLFNCHGGKHNDHLSPYSELHPDILERRFHQLPEVEMVTWDNSDPLWYISLCANNALDAAYRHARIVLGDALQPTGWNRRDPWYPYDFEGELKKLGMPFIPQPLTFQDGAYPLPFETLAQLQHEVHRNNFYAMCITAIAYIVNAVKMNHYHNLCYAGYMRGSPGFVSAHRRWCRLNGFPVLDRSEDDESAADFELLEQEQSDSVGALAHPNPAASMELEQDEAIEAASDIDWEAGAYRRHFGHSDLAPCAIAGSQTRAPFAVANNELLRSLRQRRDDLRLGLAATGNGAPPVLQFTFPDFDIDDLIERLEALPGEPEASDLLGWDYDAVSPVRDRPTEGATSTAPMADSPRWPNLVQQATPPLNWEDFWCTLEGEGIDTADSQGTLAEHVILTHPSVSL